MKAYTEYIWINTPKKRDIINLTGKVSEIVHKSNIKEGFVLVSAMHITAGVIVNDDEPGFHKDLWKWLEELAPYRPDYEHHKTGENNGDAHLKSVLVHHQVIVPITDHKLDLGPWQQIFYLEFDGCRKKRILIKVIGE
jgi:secondary thiamine-phosphate synthase enzyme